MFPILYDFNHLSAIEYNLNHFITSLKTSNKYAEKTDEKFS